jgi:hypothetical protein
MLIRKVRISNLFLRNIPANLNFPTAQYVDEHAGVLDKPAAISNIETILD